MIWKTSKLKRWETAGTLGWSQTDRSPEKGSIGMVEHQSQNSSLQGVNDNCSSMTRDKRRVNGKAHLQSSSSAAPS